MIISDSEYEIMTIIWKAHPVGSKEIIDEIKSKKDWSPQTVKTLINRLMKKGAIDYKKEGRLYYYFPLIEKETFLKKENSSFLKKFYNNSISQVVTHFVEQSDISKEEIEALRKILNEVDHD